MATLRAVGLSLSDIVRYFYNENNDYIQNKIFRTTTDNASNGLRAMRICLSGDSTELSVENRPRDTNIQNLSDDDCFESSDENDDYGNIEAADEIDEEMFFVEKGLITEQDEVDATSINGGNCFEGLLHSKVIGTAIEYPEIDDSVKRMGNTFQISCFCHSLHLMVGDGLKNLDSSLQSTISKCHALSRLALQFLNIFSIFIVILKNVFQIKQPKCEIS